MQLSTMGMENTMLMNRPLESKYCCREKSLHWVVKDDKGNLMMVTTGTKRSLAIEPYFQFMAAHSLALSLMKQRIPT